MDNNELKDTSSFWLSSSPLVLGKYPKKQQKKLLVLKVIVQQFEKDKVYSEKEVNSVLKAIYADYAVIRRALVDYGFMERTTDCKNYWII